MGCTPAVSARLVSVGAGGSGQRVGRGETQGDRREARLTSPAEFLFPYGDCQFASKMGMLTANHFLTVVRGQENLRKLGEKVLWEGAQEVVFDYATDEE